MSRKTSGGALETVKTIFYAIVIAIVLRTVLFEPFNIPSGSMIPSLLIGDYLFVSKFSYGYSRYSLPLGLNLFSGRILARTPERGDIAVFKLPSDNATDYIKRVIGLPGDRIQVIQGILHINEKPVKRERVEDYVMRDRFGNMARVAQFVETLPNGRSHRIIETDGDQWSTDNTRVFVVPPDHYFMMGDNRDNSMDSRYLSHVGFVPAQNLVGRAEILFFSVDGSAALWEVWKWPWAIRFGRFFQPVD